MRDCDDGWRDGESGRLGVYAGAPTVASTLRLFFFLMIRPPRSSPLFPSPPLSRSRFPGKNPPPPPPSVPAIEPDIRGAVTIREQLDKHRTLESCAACHAKIDPAGFALESFDVMGGWRDNYRAMGPGKHPPGFGKNGQPFEFHLGPRVDPSGVLPGGGKFQNIRE